MMDTLGATNQASVRAAKPIEQVLRLLSDQIDFNNVTAGRLTELLQRVNGPFPQADTSRNPEPEPVGYLPTAHHLLARMSQQREEISNLLSSLEDLL